MQGARDLLASERGVFCLLLLAIVTMFVLVKVVDAALWVEVVKFLVLTLVTAKTITNATATVTGKYDSSSTPTPGITP